MGGLGAGKHLMVAVSLVMVRARLRTVRQHQSAGQWGGRESR